MLQIQTYPAFPFHGNAAVTSGAGRLALEASRVFLQHGLMGLVILDLSLAGSKCCNIPKNHGDQYDRVVSLCPSGYEVDGCSEAWWKHTFYCFVSVTFGLSLGTSEWDETILQSFILDFE